MNNRKRMIARVYSRNPTLLKEPSVWAKLIMSTSKAGEITKSLAKAADALIDLARAITGAIIETTFVED